MVNKSVVKRLCRVFFLLMVLMTGGQSLMAFPIAGGLLSEGMLVSQPEKFSRAAEIEKTAAVENRNTFFGTLGPELSDAGSVRTYSIKVVKKLKDSDWNKVKKSNTAALDKSNKTLIRPVVGRVSSLFGKRKHPKTKSWHFHSGIDIVARKGTPIMAAMAGKVTYSGWKRGYGMVIIIDHGDELETVYAHCSRVSVKTGQMVNVGQRIGSVGSTGVATGSHLHFEVRRGGNVRNPFRYLKN
jgi:murein DD-endopeptidase MepM/ murein hydrolase activator NlpD